MHIKTTMKYHLTPVRILSKRQQIARVGKDMKKGLSMLEDWGGGVCKLMQPIVGRLLKQLKRAAYKHRKFLSWLYQKKAKTLGEKI